MKVEQKISNDETVLSLAGPIDESFNLPNCQSAKRIRLDLDSVNFVDSIGVRAWCRWADQHKKVSVIMLERCPIIMIKHFNIIRGFLSSNMVVESFYVPYHSDETDESISVLFRAGFEFEPSGALKLPDVKGPAGEKMEMDVVPQSYFKFLTLIPAAR